MNIDLELEAPELQALDAADRRNLQHDLKHWHPLDPERYERQDEEHAPEQEISSTGAQLLSQEGQQLLKKVDNA